jgi:integrase
MHVSKRSRRRIDWLGSSSGRAQHAPRSNRDAYAREPFNGRFKWNAEQVYDFILFMANTGLRPDEAFNLQHRDITIVATDATGNQILEIEVRGKRGVGHMQEHARRRARLSAFARAARNPFKARHADNGLLFPGNHTKLFNNPLDRTGLKLDRDEKPRTSYSLRHTYICMRLMEGADTYQIAKNCRTSVEMIEKHYAIHLKNTLDASAINVLKPKAETGVDGPQIRSLIKLKSIFRVE